jgi:hypothetical protein
MSETPERKTGDSPRHADPDGVNPAGLGPAQPGDTDRARKGGPAGSKRQEPGRPSDTSKDAEGGGI